jgi:hypothetical protein
MEDLRRDVVLVMDHDTTSVDYLETEAVVLGKPMHAVARDTRLIADNGAPLSRNAIKEGGLSYVGPAHNDHCGNGVGHETS